LLIFSNISHIDLGLISQKTFTRSQASTKSADFRALPKIGTAHAVFPASLLKHFSAA
jgi:hypothetical protein